MTCVHCEHAVESAVAALPGTVKVKANHRKGAVDVRYDETMTTH
ncbi:MAG: cation transporter, partial [Actinomycetia bacterium]|nr:cation transporter [Actinomycetes bacterium]